MVKGFQRVLFLCVCLLLMSCGAISLQSRSTTKFVWDVEIIQNGKIITGQNGEFKLRKESFVIRVKLPKPMTVLLNVLDRDDNFKKIYPGLYADDDCEHGVHTFCSYVGMGFIAESPLNQEERLQIDMERGEGHHILSYSGENEHRWNKVKIIDKETIFERNVSRLLLIGPNTQGVTTYIAQDIPIEEFAGQKLYLVFLVKHREEKIISEDELKKIILVFE
ncbi:MAG: hypothetical protein JXA33_23050 [Anaerolineae bacterium]|nr:hypothetical protein [Anaerolineae bacterium]